VVVTGYSDAGGTINQFYTAFDYYTAKYSGTNGMVIWEKRYSGPGNENDYAQSLAVDNSGNVIVTGYSFHGAQNESYTAKYASADGSLIWEKRYDGSSIPPGAATFKVTLDAAGNAIVTGTARAAGFYYDYCTAKYAASDGALIWERQYKGLGYGQAVAVDANGAIIVTGYSNGDLVTLKYVETTVPVLALVSRDVTGQIRFQGKDATPGDDYTLEQSTDLEHWNAIQTIRASEVTFELMVDSGPTTGGGTFYRLRH
jgi:hypothetical protein